MVRGAQAFHVKLYFEAPVGCFDLAVSVSLGHERRAREVDIRHSKARRVISHVHVARSFHETFDGYPRVCWPLR